MSDEHDQDVQTLSPAEAVELEQLREQHMADAAAIREDGLSEYAELVEAIAHGEEFSEDSMLRVLDAAGKSVYEFEIDLATLSTETNRRALVELRFLATVAAAAGMD